MAKRGGVLPPSEDLRMEEGKGGRVEIKPSIMSHVLLLLLNGDLRITLDRWVPTPLLALLLQGGASESKRERGMEGVELRGAPTLDVYARYRRLYVHGRRYFRCRATGQLLKASAPALVPLPLNTLPSHRPC